MNRIGNAVARVLEIVALTCLVLALLLGWSSPSYGGFCNSWCLNGDCYVYGIPPTCKDAGGVQKTCPTGYPGCGGCICQGPLGGDCTCPP